MILPYFWRLLFLCAATFFAVHTTAALAARFFIPAAIRFSNRMRPRAAAQFLLIVRLAPAALAVFSVLVLCIPSYLSFEPGATSEEVGLACLIAALLTAALLLISIVRGIRAVVSTSAYAHRCVSSGSQLHSPAVSASITVIDESWPVIAMVGVFHPRFVISRAVVNTLLPDELDCALRHERAHRTSADNFKRLLLLLAPDVLPFVSRAFSALDRTWVTLSEWAADDFAVADDPQRSVSLAGALVRVAQMGAAPRLSPLCTELVSGNSSCVNQDLSARVDRLLHTSRMHPQSPKRFGAVLTASIISIAFAALVVILRPETLHSVHRLLENLTH
jgi:beta-lactamase regulating signal transducer with metallopeptidase domain